MEKGRNGIHYDLSIDPGETTNVIAGHPEISAQLTQIVQNGRTTSGEPQPNDGSPWWETLNWIDRL